MWSPLNVAYDAVWYQLASKQCVSRNRISLSRGLVTLCLVARSNGGVMAVSYQSISVWRSNQQCVTAAWRRQP